MSLFIDEIVEENAKLKEEIEELEEELRIAREHSNNMDWFNDNQYQLLTKYEKVIDILKKHIHADKFFTKTMDEPVYSLDLKELKDNEHYCRYNYLTQEEYELLKEVFGDE